MSDMSPAAFSEDVALIQKFHSATGPYCVVCPGDSAGEQPDCEHRPRWCVKCEGAEWPCFTRMAADRLAAHRCAPSVAAPPREDREELIPSIEAALFGTTDGGLLDDEDASVPVGEFRRLLREVWAGTERGREARRR